MSVCWILAIIDDAEEYKIRGCIRLVNTMRSEYSYGNFYQIAADDYRHLFFGGHKDVVVLWIITIGFCLFVSITTAIRAYYRTLLYLITAILNSIIFLCCFTVVIDRTRYNKQCEYYKSMLRVRNEHINLQTVFCSEKIRTMKNIYKSYEFIWGSSVAFIIASGYQIGCAIILIYRERKKDEPEPGPKSKTKGEPESEPRLTPER